MGDSARAKLWPAAGRIEKPLAYFWSEISPHSKMRSHSLYLPPSSKLIAAKSAAYSLDAAAKEICRAMAFAAKSQNRQVE
jgi:hypothetical protein